MRRGDKLRCLQNFHLEKRVVVLQILGNGGGYAEEEYNSDVLEQHLALEDSEYHLNCPLGVKPSIWLL